MVLTYITQTLNEMQISYNNVLFMAFSQMEAILNYLLKQMNKKRILIRILNMSRAVNF